MAQPITISNGPQTATFAPVEGGYRPEWMRLGRRPMVRFKDHEWLNVGALRVTVGELRSRTDSSAEFGGTVRLAGTPVDWSVRVAAPADGRGGFTVTTHLVPREEDIEVLEAMTCFELPYEYDGSEHTMTVMAQQPVFHWQGDRPISGAGYTHPFWYYGRPGRAHRTFCNSSPMMASRVWNADGTNERVVMLLGNWNVCSYRDLFAQPTRALGAGADDLPFPDPELRAKAGLRGMKYLVGAVNWNTSMHKDPNVLAAAGAGLAQEVTIDFRDALPGGRWDAFLADGWERLCGIHFPRSGRVPACEVARALGASWTEAAAWLSDQFARPEGCPGFFFPERGPCVYAPHTRPKWDEGVPLFAGQFAGPVAYLAHLYKNESWAWAADRLEALFNRDASADESADAVWTIGPTPFYAAVVQKARIVGVRDETRERLQRYFRRRGERLLSPAPGQKSGDAGMLAWEAYANLVAADVLDREERLGLARELLVRVNAKLAAEFWQFNCAAEGDLVGGGQARPLGHAMALAANMEAHRRLGGPEYLAAAEQAGNLLLAMHYVTWNESPVADLDTRGWAHGSTGGRDQYCHLPPWETSYSLQQFAHLIHAGKARPGFYDVLWLHSHTGLAMFPKARTMKRLYTPDLAPVYRPIHSLPTEREFYLKLPYLAYEEPWDQTMLAGYQGVEPIVLSLYCGGGLVAAEDDRVLALVPEAALYVPGVDKAFTVHLWNPTPEPISTRLYATVAARQGRAFRYSGAVNGTVSAADAFTAPIPVPSRQVVQVVFTAA